MSVLNSYKSIYNIFLIKLLTVLEAPGNLIRRVFWKMVVMYYRGVDNVPRKFISICFPIDSSAGENNAIKLPIFILALADLLNVNINELSICKGYQSVIFGSGIITNDEYVSVINVLSVDSVENLCKEMMFHEIKFGFITEDKLKFRCNSSPEFNEQYKAIVAGDWNAINKKGGHYRNIMNNILDK